MVLSIDVLMQHQKELLDLLILLSGRGIFSQPIAPSLNNSFPSLSYWCTCCQCYLCCKGFNIISDSPSRVKSLLHHSLLPVKSETACGEASGVLRWWRGYQDIVSGYGGRVTMWGVCSQYSANWTVSGLGLCLWDPGLQGIAQRESETNAQYLQSFK